MTDFDLPVSTHFTVKELVLMAVTAHEFDISDEMDAQRDLRKRLRAMLKKHLPDATYERLFGQYERADELREAEARVRELQAA